MRDYVIAAGLAVLALCTTLFIGDCGIPPDVWADYAVAAGVRPAVQASRGYWTFFSAWIVDFGGMNAFRLLGRLTLAGFAALGYIVCMNLLQLAMRSCPQYSRYRLLVMRVSSALASLAFVASEPIWMSGLFFSECTLLTLIALVAVAGFLMFLRTGRLRYASLLGFLLGVLAAESVAGFLLLSVFLIVYAFVPKENVTSTALVNPVVQAIGKWEMTVIFVAGFAAGVALNCYAFVCFGGVSASGSVSMAYAVDYWRHICNAASFGGWMMWMLVFLAPCVVTIARFPVAADEEKLLGYPTGVVTVLCGIAAFSQCCGISSLWFWTYFPLNSSFMHTLGMIMGMLTIGVSMTVVCIDAFCREHTRLVKQFVGEESVQEVGSHNPFMLMALRGLLAAAVPLLFVAVLWQWRSKSVTREMLSIIDSAVSSTVDECEDARRLFTDGNFDPALEIEAARRGLPLQCISLMGGDVPSDIFLRTRGFEDDGEDRLTFSIDGGMGLRSWIHSKPERLLQAACQMGFDLWKREGKAIPPIGGFVSRPTGWTDPAVRERGIKASLALADRILALHEAGGVDGCSVPSVRDAFFAVQWRLARMCMYRGENLDNSGDAEGALREGALAKRLNDSNLTYQRIVSAMQRRGEHMQCRLTPREGLQLTLSWADFRMAKVYADVILAGDENDPDANFAVAMYYVQARQFARAAEFLKRSLIRRPNEPALYNNLAMVEIESGNLDSALKHVNKALEIIPDSAEILDTRRKVKAAMKTRGK